MDSCIFHVIIHMTQKSGFLYFLCHFWGELSENLTCLKRRMLIFSFYYLSKLSPGSILTYKTSTALGSSFIYSNPLSCIHNGSSFNIGLTKKNITY